MPYDHAHEYGKQYGYAVLTAAFFAVAASKIRQTIRLCRTHCRIFRCCGLENTANNTAIAILLPY